MCKISRKFGAAFAVSLFMGLLPVHAGEVVPKADEAIVLIPIHSSGTVRSLEFWRQGEKQGFWLTTRGGLWPQVVKAGHYYLHAYTPVYFNVPTIVLPAPKDPAGFIDVRAGTVTYVGDIRIIDMRSRPGAPAWQFAITLRPETLLQVKREDPWLTKYPLMIVTAKNGPTPVSWGTESAARAKGAPN